MEMELWPWLRNSGQLPALRSSPAVNLPGVCRWRVRVENPTSDIKAPIFLLQGLGKPLGGPCSCPVCSWCATLLCSGGLCPRLVRLGQESLQGREHPSCAQSPPSSLSVSTCLGLSSQTASAFCCLWFPIPIWIFN